MLPSLKKHFAHGLFILPVEVLLIDQGLFELSVEALPTEHVTVPEETLCSWTFGPGLIRFSRPGTF